MGSVRSSPRVRGGDGSRAAAGDFAEQPDGEAGAESHEAGAHDGGTTRVFPLDEFGDAVRVLDDAQSEQALGVDAGQVGVCSVSLERSVMVPPM